MTLRSLLLSLLGALLFLAGMLAGWSLSAGTAWGESEAVIRSSYAGESRMKLECPLMLSPRDSGVVRAEIINLTDSDIKPVVLVEVSRAGSPRIISQTLSLGTGESETLRWSVDSSDRIFERLILVSVLQSRYRDNPPRMGSCGILVYSLFSLTGMQTFGLVFAISLAAMLSGGALWWYARRPLNKSAEQFAQAGAVLAGMTILALLSTLPRWWGFTLFFDALILLVIGVVFTELILFSHKQDD